MASGEMMRIEFRLYASLARYMPEPWRNSSKVEVREGTTVKDLLESIKVPLGAVKVVFVNGVHAEEDQAIRDGDRIGVFPPVAGG
ncbi:MAG: MoaD/ThiS family protein [Desulfatiglandales bacterium]|jgi:sulfur-carrier protein